jgi:cytochrome c5
MKKLALVLALALLAACGKQEGASTPTAARDTAGSPSAPTAAVAPSGTSPAPPPAAITADSTTNNPPNTPVGSTATLGAAGTGQDVYTKTCAVCHTAGVAGAPKLGDKADWGPRVAQGKDVLYEHAIKGYTGKKGAMPAKGGNTALADADVKAAVDYMVAQAR